MWNILYGFFFFKIDMFLLLHDGESQSPYIIKTLFFIAHTKKLKYLHIYKLSTGNNALINMTRYTFQLRQDCRIVDILAELDKKTA